MIVLGIRDQHSFIDGSRGLLMVIGYGQDSLLEVPITEEQAAQLLAAHEMELQEGGGPQEGAAEAPKVTRDNTPQVAPSARPLRGPAQVTSMSLEDDDDPPPMFLRPNAATSPL